jgi:hypothetical protein
MSKRYGDPTAFLENASYLEPYLYMFTILSVGVWLMEKFEEMVVNFGKLSIEEKMQGMKKATEECICPDCPTYNDCAREAREGLFCAHGSSFICITQENACICMQCPVWKEYGQARQYFCNRGSEAAQRWVEGVRAEK